MFALYRIIGNDLYPRHEKGQSYRNLQFILEHEPELDGCEKRWVVNRIVDTDEEERILALLRETGQEFLHLSFSSEEYAKCRWDVGCQPAPGFLYSKQLRKLRPDRRGKFFYATYRHKINYVMNNNGARNAALRDGRGRAEWILPWDGNCFLTAAAWEAIRAKVEGSKGIPCFLVPMARIQDNNSLLSSTFAPEAKDEPQIIFHRGASVEFDESVPYGRRPKVDLFWRLGIPGPWDRWRIEAWDPPKPRPLPGAGKFEYAGWVARLDSGRPHLETRSRDTLGQRGLARVDAVTGLLDELDVARIRRLRSDDSPLFYDLEILDRNSGEERESVALFACRKALFAAADEALGRGPHSVVDKTTLPPSKNPHDYWHPSPYYWPRRFFGRWLPMKRRDGERVPGTQLYEPGSDRYDRTHLQRLLDDVTVLALAWRAGGNMEYANYAATLARTWFLNPATRMNPHLKFAQIRQGKDRKHGCKSGVIELKDLYFFLDAMRLLRGTDAWSNADEERFRLWLRQYLEWLLTSPQGIGESGSPNNHSTCYDLQVASVASYLGEFVTVHHTLRRSLSRIGDQFTEEGEMPYELERTLTRHYCAFNLQAWVHLARLAEAHGEDLWNHVTPGGASIKRAMKWFLSHSAQPWPFKQIAPFDPQRLIPLQAVYASRFEAELKVNLSTDLKPVFFPHDGIRPFWYLDTPVGKWLNATPAPKPGSR